MRHLVIVNNCTTFIENIEARAAWFKEHLVGEGKSLIITPSDAEPNDAIKTLARLLDATLWWEEPLPWRFFTPPEILEKLERWKDKADLLILIANPWAYVVLVRQLLGSSFGKWSEPAQGQNHIKRITTPIHVAQLPLVVQSEATILSYDSDGWPNWRLLCDCSPPEMRDDDPNFSSRALFASGFAYSCIGFGGTLQSALQQSNINPPPILLMIGVWVVGNAIMIIAFIWFKAMMGKLLLQRRS